MSAQSASVESVFLEAVEKVSPGQRDAFLDTACDGDADLRRRVEALLKAHDDAGTFLSAPAIQPDACDTANLRAAGDDRTPIDNGGFREAVDSEYLALDFLDPPRQSGHLGSLGPYDITEVIGQGGMGVVFKAHDLQLNRIVAIKVLAPVLAFNASARKRFLREAQAAAAVTHDYVVTIHAIAEAKGLPHLVMEYVTGMSLEQKINSDGPLEVEEIVRIGRQIAAGLAAAHEHGLIHRDIKPANILLEDGAGRVKITDFGLARAVNDATLTQTGAVAGTPQYMAPEQARGDLVDHRADLFSLGSVLYALCTGRAPFPAETSMAVLKRVCEDTPRAIGQINPAIPEWLVAIVERLHAKDPADRIQSASEVADLLGQHLAQLHQPSVTPVPARVQSSAAEEARVKRIGLRGRWIMAAFAFVVIVAGFGFALPQIIIRIRGTDGDVSVIKVPAGGSVEIEGGPVTTVPAPVYGHLRRFVGHEANVWSVAFHPDPKTPRAISGSEDGTVRLWDLETGIELHRFGGAGRVYGVAFSPDGRHVLACCGDNSLRLWDVESGMELRRFEGHTKEAWTVAFSPDGTRILSGGRDFTLRLWDAETGQEIRTFEGHTGWVKGVAFSPDGRRALSCGGHWDKQGNSLDRTVRLWDLESGEELHRFEGHMQGVDDVAFAPNGKWGLSCSHDETVRLWDLESGEVLRYFDGHKGFIGSVAFSPDGGRVLGGGASAQIVYLWDVKTGELLCALAGHTHWINDVAFSPDGRRALSSSQIRDKTVRLWQLPP